MGRDPRFFACLLVAFYFAVAGCRSEPQAHADAVKPTIVHEAPQEPWVVPGISPQSPPVRPPQDPSEQPLRETRRAIPAVFAASKTAGGRTCVLSFISTTTALTSRTCLESLNEGAPLADLQELIVAGLRRTLSAIATPKMFQMENKLTVQGFDLAILKFGKEDALNIGEHVEFLKLMSAEEFRTHIGPDNGLLFDPAKLEFAERRAAAWDLALLRPHEAGLRVVPLGLLGPSINLQTERPDSSNGIPVDMVVKQFSVGSVPLSVPLVALEVSNGRTIYKLVGITSRILYEETQGVSVSLPLLEDWIQQRI